MTTSQVVFFILLVAVVTAVLYVWGLRKSMLQQQDMGRSLLHACGSRVLKRLKKQPTITQKEIESLIDGLTVGAFWSRKKLKVQDPAKFSGQLIEFLLDQQYIEEIARNTYKRKA